MPLDSHFVKYVTDVRLGCLEIAKDVAGCIAIAEMWEKQKRSDGESLYRAAWLRAKTAANLKLNNRQAAGQYALRLQTVQRELTSDRFRVYTNPDVVGVELGGALKNVIGIAAGISDGLGLGDNAKSALLTRGLAEMTRFGVALGADAATFAGLGGLGDLITTCVSQHGRNLEEISLMVQAGLTIEEALLAATRNGAELCGVADRLGGIKPGYLFDAIILNQDPSDPTIFMQPGAVAGVFKGGIAG